LEVPAHLQRNHPNVQARGPENTGQKLIDLSIKRLALDDLSQTDVLDIGCGVRFTQTILNRNIPIKSYTGIDVDETVIGFLQDQVDDPRFAFAHWAVRNPFYNPDAARMTKRTTLPLSGTFDLVWLFSVFTHLAPEDADALLAIIRPYARPNGALVFSALIDDSVQSYEESEPDRPGARVVYNEQFLRGLVVENGWTVSRVYPPEWYMQFGFVCRPA
jgi:SAM-dependent methyltransferase